MSRTGKFLELESRLEVTRGWGKRGYGELLFSGHRVSDWGDEKVSETVVMVVHTMSVINAI